MLQRKQKVNNGTTEKNETKYVAETKKEITKKPFYKKSLLLATFLSLLCSSSASCATNVSIGNTAITTPSVKVNSEPFFPFGFYYVSWYDSEHAQRLNALHEIANAGFNTMYAPLDLDLEDDSFLNEAARLGVYVIGEFNDDPMSVVNKYKNKPAILGWLVSDDSDNGKKTPEQILQFHSQLKDADSQHITYLSGGNPSRIGQFVNSADLVGMQSYPITAEALSATDYSISSAVKAAAPSNRPVIANLQTFAWSGMRPPTSKEVRNMTYQSLINGAKGIIYYTYQDSDWKMTEHPALWNGIKSLVPEIKQLSPILLNGGLTKIATRVPGVFAGMWKYQNQAVVVVINTSATSTKQVSIGIPSQKTTGVKAMFRGRPSGMVINGDKLSGSIKPKDVHVYSFQI